MNVPTEVADAIGRSEADAIRHRSVRNRALPVVARCAASADCSSWCSPRYGVTVCAHHRLGPRWARKDEA